ncbi:hypothetical protein HXX76_011802 [Chlamydomonas incerta]|uniref:Uncharacterized protein n=1 Tax=Chlamydomonas incerta TaxID=51695 RepID=A0A835SYA3_CHLIN|nr:hypothetical protein HXX76_011802 [Chlamydomonas incerta]|eukprot:KAG2428121.1 hypothetical protein HXX76_011802 [Chlamydomonas incerta]
MWGSGLDNGSPSPAAGASPSADADAATTSVRLGSHGDALAAADAASAPLPKLPATALGTLLAAGASRRSAARRSSFDAVAAATSTRSSPGQREKRQLLQHSPQPPQAQAQAQQQPRGRWLVTYVDLTWGTTGRMFADVVVVATGAPRPSLPPTPIQTCANDVGSGGSCWYAPPALVVSGGAAAEAGVEAEAGSGRPAAAAPGERGTGAASSPGAAGTPVRCLAAQQVTPTDLARAAGVTVVGQGLAARDVACAAALLRHGGGVSIRTTELGNHLPWSTSRLLEGSGALVHSQEGLLSSARRRALAASLQPHYAAPQPGPLGKALRVPTKRRFWALVKDKLSLGRGGGGSSSVSNSSTGEHLVLWAPSLHDPSFMPFLSAPLRQALLGGAGAAEGDGDLALYRGMVHPDVPGLAFVGLEAHAGSSLLLLELQAQWLAANMAGRLALPPAAAMRADVAAQRVWRSGALAHPLMSAGGSLARRHEQCCLEQLRQDLHGVGITSHGEPPLPSPARTGGSSSKHLPGGPSRNSSPAVPAFSRRSSRGRGNDGRASLVPDGASAAAKSPYAVASDAPSSAALSPQDARAAAAASSSAEAAVVAEAMAAAAEASKAAAAAVAAATASKAVATAAPASAQAREVHSAAATGSPTAPTAPASPRAFRSFRVGGAEQPAVQVLLSLKSHQTAPGEASAGSGRYGVGLESAVLNARDVLRVGAVAARNRRSQLTAPGSPSPAAAPRRSSKRALGWAPSFSRLSHNSRDEGDGGCSSSGGGVDASYWGGWSSGGGSGRGGRSGRGSAGGSGGVGATGAPGGYMEIVGAVQQRLRRQAPRPETDNGGGAPRGSASGGGRYSSGSGSRRNLDVADSGHGGAVAGAGSSVVDGSAAACERSGRLPVSSAVFFHATLGAAAAAAAAVSSPPGATSNASDSEAGADSGSRTPSAPCLPPHVPPPYVPPPHVPPPYVAHRARRPLSSPPPPSQPASPRAAAEEPGQEMAQLHTRLASVAQPSPQHAAAAGDEDDAAEAGAVSCGTADDSASPLQTDAPDDAGSASCDAPTSQSAGATTGAAGASAAGATGHAAYEAHMAAQAAADAAARYALSVASASPFSTATAPPSPPRTWHHQLFRPRPTVLMNLVAAQQRLTRAMPADAAMPAAAKVATAAMQSPPALRTVSVSAIIREFQGRARQRRPQPSERSLLQGRLLSESAAEQQPAPELLPSVLLMTQSSQGRASRGPQDAPDTAFAGPSTLAGNLGGSSNAAYAARPVAAHPVAVADMRGGGGEASTLMLLTAVTSDPEAAVSLAAAASEGQQLLISSCSLVTAPSLTSLQQQQPEPEPAVGSTAAAAMHSPGAALGDQANASMQGSGSSAPRVHAVESTATPANSSAADVQPSSPPRLQPSLSCNPHPRPRGASEPLLKLPDLAQPPALQLPPRPPPPAPAGHAAALSERPTASAFSSPAAALPPHGRPWPLPGYASTSSGASPASPYHGISVSSAKAGRVTASKQPFARLSSPGVAGGTELDADDGPLSPTTRRRQLAVQLDSPTLIQLRQLLGLGLSESSGPLPLLPLPEGSTSGALGAGRRGRSRNGGAGGGLLSRRGSQQDLQQLPQQKQRRAPGLKAYPRRQLSSPTLQASAGSASGCSSSGGGSPAVGMSREAPAAAAASAGEAASASAAASAAAAARAAATISESGAVVGLDLDLDLPAACNAPAPAMSVAATSAPLPCVTAAAAAAAGGCAGVGLGCIGASSAVLLPDDGCTGVWAHRISACNLPGAAADSGGSGSPSSARAWPAAAAAAAAVAAVNGSGVAGAAAALTMPGRGHAADMGSAPDGASEVLPTGAPEPAVSAAGTAVAEASEAAASDAVALDAAAAGAVTAEAAAAASMLSASALSDTAAAAAATDAVTDAAGASKSAASSLELSLRTLVVDQLRKDALQQQQQQQQSAHQGMASWDSPLPAPPPPSPATTRPGSETTGDPAAEAEAGMGFFATQAAAAPAEPALHRPLTLPPGAAAALRLPGLTRTPPRLVATACGPVRQSGSSSAVGGSAGSGVGGSSSSSGATWTAAADGTTAALAGAATPPDVGSTAAVPAAAPAVAKSQWAPSAMVGSLGLTAPSMASGSASHSSPFTVAAAPTAPPFDRHSWQPMRAQTALPGQRELGQQQPPREAHQWQARKAQSSSGALPGGAAASEAAPVAGAAGSRGSGARRGYSWGSGVSSHGSSSGGGSSRGGSRKVLFAGSTSEGQQQVAAEARASLARAMASTAMFTSSRRILPVPEGCQVGVPAATGSIGYDSSSVSAPLPVFGRGSSSAAAFHRRSSSGMDSMGGSGFSSCPQLLPPKACSAVAGPSQRGGGAYGSSGAGTATATAAQGSSSSNAGTRGDKSAPLRRRQLSLSSLLAAAGVNKAAGRAKEHPLRGPSGCSSAEATGAAHCRQILISAPRAPVSTPRAPVSTPSQQAKAIPAASPRRSTSGPLLLRDAVATLFGQQTPAPGMLPPKAASAGSAVARAAVGAPAAPGVPYRDAGLEAALAVARGCTAWLPDDRRHPARPDSHVATGAPPATGPAASGAAAAVLQERPAQPAALPATTAAVAVALRPAAVAAAAAAPGAAVALLPAQPAGWGRGTSISIRSKSLLHNSSTASGASPTAAAGASGTTISWPRFLAPTSTGPAVATPPFAAAAATALTPPSGSATPRSCSPRSAFCLPGDLRGFHSDLLPLYPDSPPASAPQPHQQPSELGLPATVLTPSGAPAFCIRLQQRGQRGSSSMGEMLLPVSAPVELGGDLFGEAADTLDRVSLGQGGRNAASLLDSMLGMRGAEEAATGSRNLSLSVHGGRGGSAGGGDRTRHDLDRLQTGGATMGAAVAATAQQDKSVQPPQAGHAPVALSGAGEGSNTATAAVTSTAIATGALAAARQSTDATAAPDAEIDTDPCLIITLMHMSRGGPDSTAHASGAAAVGDSASVLLGGVLGTATGSGGAGGGTAAASAATAGPESHLLSSTAAGSFDFAAAADAATAVATAVAVARPFGRTGSTGSRKRGKPQEA